MKYRVVYKSFGTQTEYREKLWQARELASEVGYSGSVLIQWHNGDRWITVESYK